MVNSGKFLNQQKYWVHKYDEAYALPHAPNKKTTRICELSFIPWYYYYTIKSLKIALYIHVVKLLVRLAASTHMIYVC
jgi:hypothetical protein